MLLPMPMEIVRELSLTNHIAFSTCIREAGNRHLLNQLTKALYLSLFMQLAGTGIAPLELFTDAEAALDRSVIRAEQEGVWRIDPEDAGYIQAMLTFHDQQIMEITGKDFALVTSRLDRLLRLGHPESPIKSFVSDLAR
ncbi:hypothetical protein ACV229_16130 [Burkholderia sp. MR1-5-21]